jgi:hypothetical protein
MNQPHEGPHPPPIEVKMPADAPPAHVAPARDGAAPSEVPHANPTKS